MTNGCDIVLSYQQPHGVPFDEMKFELQLEELILLQNDKDRNEVKTLCGVRQNFDLQYLNCADPQLSLANNGKEYSRQTVSSDADASLHH